MREGLEETLTLQGLLPKRRKEFAHSIGSTIEEHLLSADDVTAILNDPDVHKKLEGMLIERIDRFFDQKLVTVAPMFAGFMKGPLVEQIKGALVRESSDMLLASAGTFTEVLDERLNLKQMVEQRIMEFDFLKLESIILQVASKELRWIEVLGAILGFTVGVVQVLLLYLLG